MKLTEFIALTPQEKQLERELVELAQAKTSAETLMTKVLSAKEQSLFKIALNNPLVDRLLQSASLCRYWDDLWRRAGVNPRGCRNDSSKPTQEYLPMPTIPTFNLLKGLFVYEEYRRLTSSNATQSALSIRNAADYLALAADLGCFFAMNALCENGLSLLRQDYNDQLAQIIIATAQKAADLYWTPGYLLLANVYKELNKYKDEGMLRAIILPLKAYEALVLAQSLGANSNAMVNNAYQGKTIQEASNGAFKTFLQSKIKFISDLSISSSSQNLVERRAKLVVNDIEKQFPKGQTAPVEEPESFELDIDLIPTF